MLSNFDLEYIAENYGFLLTAVVSKDELKSLKPHKCGNYIINLESSTEGRGTHWTCLAVRDTKACYMDSFGVLMPQEVIDFCKRIPKSHLGYSEIQIQNIKADTCGWFCAGLLIYLNENPNKDIYLACNDFVSKFSYDTTKNNMILRSYYCGLLYSKRLRLIEKLYSQK